MNMLDAEVTVEHEATFSQDTTVKSGLDEMYLRFQRNQGDDTAKHVDWGLAGQLASSLQARTEGIEDRVLDRASLESIEGALLELSHPANQHQRKMGIINLATFVRLCSQNQSSNG